MFLAFLVRYPPYSPPFPYPTLFRSVLALCAVSLLVAPVVPSFGQQKPSDTLFTVEKYLDYEQVADPQISPRSEEHTSELQSRGHLVCRLLLEKKNLCLSQLRLSSVF